MKIQGKMQNKLEKTGIKKQKHGENVEANKLKGQKKKNQNGNKKIKTSKKNGNKEN